MKIAMYAATFVPNKDGVAKTLHELVRTIKEDGHEVRIWSSDVPKDVAEEFSVNYTPSFPIFAYPAYRFGLFRPRNRKELDEFKPDLIHISTPDFAGLGFLRYGKKRDVPVASVFHTDFPSYLKFYHVPFLEAPLWAYLRWFYNNCDLVLSPTEQIKRKLEAKGMDNIAIWARGIHLERYNPSNRSEEFRDRYDLKGRKVILFSGRFVPYKGLDVVISVYNEFKRMGRKDVRFMLIGSGPEEANLRKRMPDAIFPGYLTGNDLYRTYASVDLLLFPSTTETFGNVILEALASGLPCIVSDQGGCRELIELSDGGLVSKAGDVRSFTENCVKLLENNESYERFRNNGISFSKKMSWSKINNSLLKKYECIVQRK